MEPKLLKVGDFTFEKAEFCGRNESGFLPIGDKVLVLPDRAAEKTMGGLYQPAEIIERNTLAAETGVLVALGFDAFLWSSDRMRKWEGPRPKVGQRVYMQRYSGQVMLGADARFYRIMDDKCIGAIEEESNPFAGVVVASAAQHEEVGG